MSLRSASLGWGICCSSLQLEGIVHLGSRTNRNPASAMENWHTVRTERFIWLLFGELYACGTVICSFSLSPDMPGQNKLSFAFRRHFSVPHVSVVYYLQHLWTEHSGDHEAVSLENEAIPIVQILSAIPKLP